MSPAQRDVIRAIRRLKRSKGYPPSLDEIAVLLGVGKSDVHQKLSRLRRDGHVDWDNGKIRTLRVLT